MYFLALPAGPRSKDTPIAMITPSTDVLAYTTKKELRLFEEMADSRARVQKVQEECRTSRYARKEILQKK